jgi:hypothetical protein
MKVRQVLQDVQRVMIPQDGYEVEKTVAREFVGLLGINAQIRKSKNFHFISEAKTLCIAVIEKKSESLFPIQDIPVPINKDWAAFCMDENRCLWLLSSRPSFLYAAFTYVRENLSESNIFSRQPWIWNMGFSAEKSTFDLFLTQYARLLRGFDREKYIREYGRLGFTHIEVNALATPAPIEKGVPGEFYPDFYTYCPALDQFVSSRLNDGIYPQAYLETNLSLLIENARMALKYGLVPGLLCFEPRSVPETLFERYPTLRGARVDHPFRSFKARFNLSLVHPLVKVHYAELLTKLMKEVPELGFLTIWSNDSGAGFEHTKSLYAGRNGGAYLTREWREDREIAKAAASNIIGFFRLLRDAASQVNPDFLVVTRLESFYAERRYLWPQLKERIGVEVNSLLTRGWESNYSHPQYPDIKVLGSAYHNVLSDQEKDPLIELQERGSRCFFYHSFASHTNHEPLLGIPFPWLTYEKLQACRDAGIQALAHLGGIQPPSCVPYAVNQEIFRLFQFDPDRKIDESVRDVARKYAGEKFAGDLVKGWKLVEQAIRGFLPLSVYTHYGAVWQRLLVRPLVPDIDRIPEKERAYYEKFMCTSIHNPNRVDLAKDVLFELVSKEYARTFFQRIDKNVWPPLDSAIDLFDKKTGEAIASKSKKAGEVFQDQTRRARGLRCLYRTLRNTAVWIYAVHEYLLAKNPDRKASCRRLLNEMIELEVQNCREMIELWEEAAVEWIIISDSQETPFIHAENFPGLLRKKIILMEKHKDDEPSIDPDYMFRVADDPYKNT